MFRISVPCKWILAGEHTVLRGGTAIAFPWDAYQLTLSYEPKAQGIVFGTTGTLSEDLQPFIPQLLEKTFSLLNQPSSSLQGRLFLDSNIPIGAGLGASAALCVAVARCCVHQGWLSPEKEFEFARHLEDVFHGTSSGIDVAVLLENHPIVYSMSGYYRWTPQWLPPFEISSARERGKTSECIQRIQDLKNADPAQAEDIDQRMKTAVNQLLNLLNQPYEPLLLKEFISAIQSARSCFEDWNLITPSLLDLEKNTLRKNPICGKPTGSGGGGHWISFFEPSAHRS